MYNCVGNTERGSSVGSLIVIRPGVNTELEESTPFGLVFWGTYVASLGSSGVVRGRGKLGMIYGKRLGRRVK